MSLLTGFPGFSVGASGVVAIFVTVLAVPWVIRLSLRLGAVDWPGGRKEQAHPVPRLGGVAIALGLASSVVAKPPVVQRPDDLGGDTARRRRDRSLDGVTNAINLIDGLDGLAAGVVAIIAASFTSAPTATTSIT